MNQAQKTFLLSASTAAHKAGHPFPNMAACEAALESNYGTSLLARQANNLFGMKVHRHQVYGELALPTREFQNGKWIPSSAEWVKYPDWQMCFEDRVATLRRLAAFYPHYAAALSAADSYSYATEVSKTWSTDPERAQKVIAIFDEVTADWSAT